MPGGLILIIEDNEKSLKLVRDVLSFNGYQTVEATTAEEGIEIARTRQPALILMDIQLPSMDGVAALRELRAGTATQKIPVIAVTASAMPLERRAIMAAGFDGYLAKPLSVRELRETVRKCLENSTGEAS